MANNIQRPWDEILRNPGITGQTPREELYRAACIGAVTLLFEAGDTAALAGHVLHAAAPESRARALFALQKLTGAPDPIRGDAIRELHRLAILHGSHNAADFLRKSGLQDSDSGWNSARMLLFGQKHQLLKSDPGPAALSELFLGMDSTSRGRLLRLGEKTLPNWTVLMRFLDDPDNTGNREALTEKFADFSPDERRLLCLTVRDPQSPARSIAADLFLKYEDETVLDLCLKNDLHPSDHSQEALFYFLSGQWERYDRADSGFRLIRAAYEQNDSGLQRRLISAGRESGNTAWLRDLSSTPENLPNSGSLSDQRLLVKYLSEQKQWNRLWELLPNLPLYCMPQVCTALRDNGFTPNGAEEQDFLLDLSSKIDAFSGLSPIPVRQKMAEGAGTALGICGGGSYTAVLFSDKRILIWDKRDAFSEPFRISSGHLSFRRAVISHDGKFLCTDCGKDGIVIFSLPGGQAIKTVSVGGTSLTGFWLQNDSRRLIALGQNGKGTVFSFPGGAVLSTFDMGLSDCSRALMDPESSLICGISIDGHCTVYDAAGHRPVTALKLPSTVLTLPDTFSGGKIAFIERGDFFSVVNLFSGKPVCDRLTVGKESPRRLMPYGQGDLLLMGTLSGNIRIFDPAAGETLAVLSLGTGSAITGMWINQEDSLLFGCSASGTVRCWDLSLFREMIRVLPLLQLPGMNRIDDFCKKYPERGVKTAAEWMKTVVSWRRRFDIEVEFDFE